MADEGEKLPNASAKPGLVIIATEDVYAGGETLARRAAEKAGAQVAILLGLGHWWMCEDPEAGARVLTDFFATLD